MKENNFCTACGAPIPLQATTCPTCRINLVRPEPARIAREIALYVAVFVVVALALMAMIRLRNIYFFAVLLQGVAPFAIVIALGIFLKRHWK